METFFRRLTIRNLILVGSLLTVLYALFSRGVYHPDEHFQILEYAHMKLFGTPTATELPWEYLLMMRPGLQPLIAYGIGWELDAAGLYDPWTLSLLLRLLAATVSVGALLLFFHAVKDTLGNLDRQKWFLILSFFLWCMAYLHVRFSSEMLAGNLLLILVALYLRDSQKERPGRFLPGLLMGLAAGAAFAFRFQTGFALLGFGLWLLVFPRPWRLIAGMLSGFSVLLAAGVLADHWLYGAWTCTPINYLRENILNSHIDSFGIDPWYYYLKGIIVKGALIPGLLAVVATFYFFYRHPKNVMTWMLVPFLLAHQMVGHKEVRFLFAVLLFAPYFIVLLAGDLPHRLLRRRATQVTLTVFLAFNTLALAFELGRHDTNVYFYRSAKRYCQDKSRLIALGLRNEHTFFSYRETTLYPRTVVSAYYMPPNLEYRLFDSMQELAEEARTCCRECPEVFLLTENDTLSRLSGLEVCKVPWQPFPQWIINHFNFNDWAGRSIRNRNIYRLKSADLTNDSSRRKRPSGLF